MQFGAFILINVHLVLQIVYVSQAPSCVEVFYPVKECWLFIVSFNHDSMSTRVRQVAPTAGRRPPKEQHQFSRRNISMNGT